VFENRVLRRIIAPGRGEIIGGWRNLHNEQLHNLYPSPNTINTMKSRRMSWVEHIAQMDKKLCLQVLGGKSIEKETIRETQT
jgi:hypothetical protein